MKMLKWDKFNLVWNWLTPIAKKRFPFILKPVEEKIEIIDWGRERGRELYTEKKKEGERKRRTTQDKEKDIKVNINRDRKNDRDREKKDSLERKRLKMRDKKR